MIDSKYLVNKVYERLNGEYSKKQISFTVNEFFRSLRSRVSTMNGFIMGLRIQGFGVFEIHGRKAHGKAHKDPERSQDFIDRYEYYKAQLPDDHHSKRNKEYNYKRFERMGILAQQKKLNNGTNNKNE